MKFSESKDPAIRTRTISYEVRVEISEIEQRKSRNFTRDEYEYQKSLYSIICKDIVEAAEEFPSPAEQLLRDLCQWQGYDFSYVVACNAVKPLLLERKELEEQIKDAKEELESGKPAHHGMALVHQVLLERVEKLAILNNSIVLMFESISKGASDEHD